MNKTVYFLGAGFSADAGGPIQNQIIQFIFEEDFVEKFQHKPRIIEARKQFISFVNETLEIEEELRDKIALEDVFTPIDRALSQGKSFKKFDIKELADLRERFHLLMGAAIQYGVDFQDKDKTYIEDFAKYINSIAKERVDNLYKDQIAIITTNWDILLDNALNKLARMFSMAHSESENPKLAVVDYCCYISSLDKNDKFIKPGLLALGKNGYNIKYLKLHGSMNWLHCPNCQRMYVKFDEKTMLIDTVKHCGHCKKNYKITSNDNAIKLRSNLLLPTFAKDYSNIQIQLIWQNGGIELSEASKVVFIGYSLPQADFEIRQLLSRCIPNHTEVEVVCYPNRNGTTKSETEKKEERDWYKTFFGKRIKSDESIIFKKVPDYISQLVSNNNL
ncbi:hypothetical protein HER18_09230 [Chryseobacterium sp. NEB161]|nr:hypothetical protein HER18_09230 [Chryseobacterium sp. NEB161]